MDRWAKALVIAIVLPCGLVLALAYALYVYGASALPKNASPSTYVAPELIRKQYRAVEAGSVTTLPRLNPITFLPFFFQAADLNSTASRQWAVLGHAARIVLWRDGIEGIKRISNRRHAAQLAGAIKISRSWSLEQITNTMLAESWFGRDARGLEAASHAFFGVMAQQLTPEESLALIVILRGSVYEPSCHRDRFMKRYKWAASKAGLDDSDEGSERALARLVNPGCSKHP